MSISNGNKNCSTQVLCAKSLHSICRSDGGYFRLEWLSDNESFNQDDCDHLLTLLHDLTSMGTAMRAVLSEALIDESLYTIEFINTIAGLCVFLD